MSELATVLGTKFYRGTKPVTMQRTTGSHFAPLQLERRVLLIMLPALAVAAMCAWLLDMQIGFSTMVEKYQCVPLAVMFALLFVWTLRSSARETRKVRYVVLALLNAIVLERFLLGLWETAADGYVASTLRNMLPWLILASLLSIFLVPGRWGLYLALLLWAVESAGLALFLAFNSQPLPVGLASDLAFTHFLGHPVILIACVVFARLRIAYGKALARAEDLQVLALEDALTGVYNRRAFSLAFRRARARQQRTGRSLSLLILDIDHFKKINDTWGHAVGDHALRSLAGVLLSLLRRTDEVFRVGGEEFAILLEETSLQGAWEVAERVRHDVKHATLLREQVITVSVGVAELADGESEGEVFARCDRALYAAKAAGRNCVQAAPPPESEDDTGLFLKAV